MQMYVLFEVHLALLENSLVILMKFGECSTIMCWIGVKIPGGAQILVTPIRGGALILVIRGMGRRMGVPFHFTKSTGWILLIR